MRTPPAAPAGSFPVEPISPPIVVPSPRQTSTTLIQTLLGNAKDPIPPPQSKEEVFEYVRCKIAQVMRTPETQESDKQRVHDDRRPRSGTPVSQHQQQQPPPPPPQQSAPQQNAHYDMEDAAKKRARLEAAERPPSRPRSTGGDMVRDRREEAVAAAAAAREEAANSPSQTRW
nr:bromodomain-containing protein 4-like [Penaeus vannamei]